MLDLNDMRYFAAVVEQGSLTAAGRFLQMPKSTISRRLAALEAALGVRLLQRSTRSVVVTPLGQQFYRHCRAMLQEADAALATAAQAQAAPMGVLRLACPVGLLHMQVAQVLADYMVRYPAVELQVLALNRAVDVIAEGVDVALRVRPDPLQDSDLALRPLGQSPQTLVASPGLLARCGQPQQPQDLLACPSLAAYSGEAVWSLRTPDGATELWPHQPRLRCSDMATLLQAAEAGLGVVQLPENWVQASLAAGRLQRALPNYSLPALNIHAVFPSRRGMLPAVRLLLDGLSACFAHAAA